MNEKKKYSIGIYLKQKVAEKKRKKLFFIFYFFFKKPFLHFTKGQTAQRKSGSKRNLKRSPFF
jgi:hypothetical protein